MKLIISPAEQAYEQYKKEESTQNLIAWFRAELTLNLEAFRCHGYHDDDVLGTCTAKVLILANQLRTKRRDGDHRHGHVLEVVGVQAV